MTALSAVWEALLPAILPVIGLVITAILQRAAATAQARWGIEIEARHREALHSALMTGITAALSRGLGTRAAIDAALTYAAGSVPDAIAALAPSGQTLQELAEAKLLQAITLPTVRMDGAAVTGITRGGTP